VRQVEEALQRAGVAERSCLFARQRHNVCLNRFGSVNPFLSAAAALQPASECERVTAASRGRSACGVELHSLPGCGHTIV
jgi:hypothetical protein